MMPLHRSVPGKSRWILTLEKQNMNRMRETKICKIF